MRTTVTAVAKSGQIDYRADPIGQREVAEKLKTKSGHATIGDIIQHYQFRAQDASATIRKHQRTSGL